MDTNFRFRVQQVGARFQLQIGMEFGRELEFVPAHRSAFAGRFPLMDLHNDAIDAHEELAAFREWLDARRDSAAGERGSAPGFIEAGSR
jgi:hypothetical protein